MKKLLIISLSLWAVVSLLWFVVAYIDYCQMTEDFIYQRAMIVIKAGRVEELPNLDGLSFVSREDEREIWVTAYNSEVGQTDDSPFVSASGKRVYDGMIAMNGVPFGTKVLIDGKEYQVWDRKSSRYDSSWADIWMESREEAMEWGIKKLKVKIYENLDNN